MACSAAYVIAGGRVQNRMGRRGRRKNVRRMARSCCSCHVHSVPDLRTPAPRMKAWRLRAAALDVSSLKPGEPRTSRRSVEGAPGASQRRVRVRKQASRAGDATHPTAGRRFPGTDRPGPQPVFTHSKFAPKNI
jgi:hypothetical protein